jgi:hypothetical protein
MRDEAGKQLGFSMRGNLQEALWKWKIKRKFEKDIFIPDQNNEMFQLWGNVSHETRL